MTAHHKHHTHAHGEHHHSHSVPKSQGLAFSGAIVLNTAFVIVEFSYGFMANSTALMADAGHNLSDVLGLLLAWELQSCLVNYQMNVIPMVYVVPR